jgi:hypothetical protein
MKKQYYIRKEGYVGDAWIWWRANSHGYTTNMDQAGIYSEEDARRICSNSTESSAYEVEKIKNSGGITQMFTAEGAKEYPESDF